MRPDIGYQNYPLFCMKRSSSHTLKITHYSGLSLSRSHRDRPKNIEITKCQDKHIRV
jgi:hypothetical protein